MPLNPKIIFHKISVVYHRFLVLVHLSPLSLAEKCRLAFGAAIMLILALALTIPFVWMSKLTTQSYYGSERARTEILFRQHFQMQSVHAQAPVGLSGTGAPVDPNKSDLYWIRYFKDKPTNLAALSRTQRKMVEAIIKDKHIQESLELDKKDGVTHINYARPITAADNCLSCHNPQGSATAFNKGELIGIAVTERPVSEYSKTVLLNSFWIVIAGLISATGAFIAFYVITQRVILSPIRQLRAMADNVAEGNLEIRSAIKTRDEYQRLSDAFNHMLDSLQSSQEKLRQANRQLDGKIVELSSRNIELYKANKVKSEFIANVSHELRTPLNAILGFAQIIREKPALLKEEKGQRYTEHIISSGKSLLTMITDLLNLAKIEAGKIDLHIEKVVVSQIFEDIEAAFMETANQKGISLFVKCGPDFPPLVTDAGKVRQILCNFTSNAIKFTPAKGSVELSCSMLDEKTARLAVSDSGCGIAPENFGKIFEKFGQVDGSITKEKSGAGLGLSISRELAGLLAASIGFESKLYEGSTFWLDLPINLTPPQDENKEVKS
jgi:two-component system, NarL family, sensor histidine kinase BarA